MFGQQSLCTCEALPSTALKLGRQQTEKDGWRRKGEMEGGGGGDGGCSSCPVMHGERGGIAH